MRAIAPAWSYTMAEAEASHAPVGHRPSGHCSPSRAHIASQLSPAPATRHTGSTDGERDGDDDFDGDDDGERDGDADGKPLGLVDGNTEGVVVKFDEKEALKALANWGVASGALKISSVVYLEARITPDYLIGVDKNDKFMVLNKGDVRTEGSRTTMVDAREKFLTAMTTGAWLQAAEYSSDSVYRFRPIEGDLKGRVFKEIESKLKGTSVWEFSP